LGQTVAGIKAEAAQAIAGQVAGCVQAVVDLGTGAAGDGLTACVQALGGVDLAPAQEAVAVVGDLLALTPATEFVAACAALMGASGQLGGYLC
jgi:predicted TPR repeat methyltransferase